MKNLLTKILVGFLFTVLCFNSQSAFAGTNLRNENSWFSGFGKQTGVTMTSFNKMKKGMLFSSANKIIGFEATVTYSARTEDGKLVQAVKWEGNNYRIITAVFVGNRLTSKYNANL